MVKSMTGFGRGEVNNYYGYQIVCEIRGVNHRFFDLGIKMSRRYIILEERIREKVKSHIVRGRVDVFFNVINTGDSGRVINVDNALAIAYYKSLKDLADNLHIASNSTAIDIFRLPEVFSLDEKEEDLEVLWGGMEQALEQALKGLISMREREGRALANDILLRNSSLQMAVEGIATRTPMVVKDYAERLKKRMAEMVPGIAIDEGRMAQEIALFADKASITEEIVRLRSHCEQMKSIFTSGESIGRKCDFLIQEMFREVNTIAAKGNDLEISQAVVEIKAELEKMREQVQNIE